MKTEETITCRRSLKPGVLLRAVAFAFALAVCSVPTHAQSEDESGEFPPPLKSLSKNEERLLDDERNISRRTTAALRLMELRLKKAEELSAATAYRAMFFELGAFHGLMDRTLDDLKRNNRRSSRDLENFKKLELALRSFTPRVEIMRREAPPRFENYVAELLKAMRDSRTEAVQPMFSDAILPPTGNRRKP
jgi:hypothetical protein